MHSKPSELREFHPKSLHKTFPICRPPVAVSPLTHEHFCDRKRWLEAHVPLTSANVKVFGCRPHEGGAAHSGAGVRKPPMEETAGRDTLVVRRALWGFECRERCG